MFLRKSLKDIRQKLHNKIWHFISLHRQLTAKESKASLSLELTQAPSQEWQAWLELHDIFSVGDQNQFGQMQSRLKMWLDDWKQTYVTIIPPFDVSDFIIADFAKANQVAVLLPQTGDLQHAGKAIIDGIMTSRYDESQDNSPLDIRFYDTNASTPIDQLYDRAVVEGAQFVIGPLEKDKVSALKKHVATLQLSQQPVPTLALNYSPAEDHNNARGFFEFGLSADDEAVAVADYAIAHGMTRALILRPDSEWGERASDAFRTAFTELDGVVLDEAKFTEPKQFSKEVRQLLGIEVSMARHRRMQEKLGEKLDYTPRRRQDIDFIFMVATPNEGRQLKPTINYHFGQDIPVLATSHIYGGHEAAKFDKDLNSILFVDIPWILNPDKALKESFNEYLPNAQSQFQRLHALGIDAFALMREYPALKHVASSSIDGSTGQLSINANGKVKRNLSWAQFKKGIVVPLEIK